MSDSVVPVVAVVVAAGSGSRLGAAVPKALVELGGVPLVVRAVDALRAGGVSDIVVTVPATHLSAFADALDGWGALLVTGGSTRQESVRLGLAALQAPDDAVVLVHDAARALVPTQVVRRVAEAVLGGAAAAVPVVGVNDSIRQIAGEGSVVVDRERLRAVQTPQAARLSVLRAAHEVVRTRGLAVTDDAAACEHAGHRVTLVEGHHDALKITEPADLAVAELLLAARSDT